MPTDVEASLAGVAVQRSANWNDISVPPSPATVVNDHAQARDRGALIGEGAREVATSASRRQASKITDAVIEYARRLMAGGPSKPDEPG